MQIGSGLRVRLWTFNFDFDDRWIDSLRHPQELVQDGAWTPRENRRNIHGHTGVQLTALEWGFVRAIFMRTQLPSSRTVNDPNGDFLMPEFFASLPHFLPAVS